MPEGSGQPIFSGNGESGPTMDDDTTSRDESDEPVPRARADWKQTISTGILLAAVLLILAAGGLLRADRTAAPAPAVERDAKPPSVPPVPVPAPQPPAAPERAAPPVRTVAPAEAAPATTAPSGDDLDLRAERDQDRLSRSRSSFTAQVLVMCKPDNTRKLLRKAGGADRLFLLPMRERGPTCYRVCWGLYGSSRDAAAASDLPAFLRKEGGRPSPRAVRDLVP